MDSNKLRLEQMDAILGDLKVRALPPAPAGGWLRAIRQALGMTTRQLAARVGVQLSTLLTAERNEAAGTIGLNQLRRVAAALDCEVRYVVVPREPLKKRLEKRAEEKSRKNCCADVGRSCGSLGVDRRRARAECNPDRPGRKGSADPAASG
ncbi:MAG: helix-turn-helix domain-containing protein [Betaproteobacteria bacterium]|nr:helix-turn-helix domain-containing protein [Betaproteobacteria bacterium]